MTELDSLPLINPDWRFIARLKTMQDRLHYMFRRRGIEQYHVGEDTTFTVPANNTWEDGTARGASKLYIEVYPPPNRFLVVTFTVEMWTHLDTGTGTYAPAYTAISSNLPAPFNSAPGAASARQNTPEVWTRKGPQAATALTWYDAIYPVTGWMVFFPPQQLCQFTLSHLCNSTSPAIHWSQFRSREMTVLVV